MDSTGGIMWVFFSCLILISYSLKSAYFWKSSVIVLCKLWTLGIAASVKHVSLMVWLRITMTGLLLLLLLYILKLRYALDVRR